VATAGANRVLAMTLHSPQVHGFFSVPVDHMNALKVLARHFRRQRLQNTIVVSPDLGNVKEASHFARSLGLPIAAGSKKRLSDDRVVVDTIVGDVDGKHVIVLDDEIANGGTMVEVLSKLRERKVKRIAVACTRPLHGQGDCAPGRAAGHRGNRHHRHRAAATREAIAQPQDSLDCAAARGSDSTHSRRRVGQRHVRRLTSTPLDPRPLEVVRRCLEQIAARSDVAIDRLKASVADGA